MLYNTNQPLAFGRKIARKRAPFQARLVWTVFQRIKGNSTASLFFCSLLRFKYNMLSKLFVNALNPAQNRAFQKWCFVMVVVRGWPLIKPFKNPKTLKRQHTVREPLFGATKYDWVHLRQFWVISKWPVFFPDYMSLLKNVLVSIWLKKRDFWNFCAKMKISLFCP